MTLAARDRGELAIILHSHMPYVEGFGSWPFGEEWLLEAIATVYLPLIGLCERWAAAGEREVLTIGVTPVLADQLVLPEVGERFVGFMKETRSEGHRLDIEALEGSGQPQVADALRHSGRDYERAGEHFMRLDGDLVGALRRLHDQEVIELWASAATHAVLPLLATEAGTRLQVGTGVESHRARFGAWSGGFWLPECAFCEGIDEQLGCAGVRAFCVDQTGVGSALDQLEPTSTSAGPVALPVDWETISLVWDQRGYPADPAYRDYHALSPHGLRPYANSGNAYLPDPAAIRAREQAKHFVAQIAERLDRYRAARGRPGLVVCALDTELLGHWWYEGAQFLEAVVEEAHSAKLALTTLPKALERHDPRRRALMRSSWGSSKDLSTWDSPRVAEFVWRARTAELALVGALAGSWNGGLPSAPSIDEGRLEAAERAARELLALQSSDWAFMAARGLAGDYPQRRVRDHASAFSRSLADLLAGVRDSRDMWSNSDGEESTGGLRGLAPGLRISALLQPPSPWGRQRCDQPASASREGACEY